MQKSKKRIAMLLILCTAIILSACSVNEQTEQNRQSETREHHRQVLCSDSEGIQDMGRRKQGGEKLHSDGS